MESNKKLIAVLGLFAIIALGISLVAFYGWYKTSKELGQVNLQLTENRGYSEELQAKLINESIRRAGAQQDAENNAKNANRMRENSELLGALGYSLATHMDSLETLLIEIDSSCVDTVNWFAENAKFSASSGDLGTANILYSGFKLDHDRQVRSYNELKSEINEDISKFGSLVEFYSTLRYYQDSDEGNTQVR